MSSFSNYLALLFAFFILFLAISKNNFTRAVSLTVTEEIVEHICHNTTNPDLCTEAFDENNLTGATLGDRAFAMICAIFAQMAMNTAGRMRSRCYRQISQAYGREKGKYTTCYNNCRDIKSRMILAWQSARVNNRGPARFEANNSMPIAIETHDLFETQPPRDPALQFITHRLALVRDSVSMVRSICDLLPVPS